jgi:hypothetical protein
MPASASAVTPLPAAMPFAESPCIGFYTADTAGSADGTPVFIAQNGFRIFISFFPFMAAVHAFRLTNIQGEIASLYTDHLSIDQAVGYLFPCRQKNPLECGPGYSHFFGTLALLQAFQILQTDSFQLFQLQGVSRYLACFLL